MAYIYQITNDINNKIYIGKTELSIEERFKEHCKEVFRREDEKRPLYRAMRKYGKEHFHISLIEETNSPNERETYWIEKKQSFKNGYNATLGGDGKRYLDYNLIISTYKEVNNCQRVADILNIGVDSVYRVLRSNSIKIRPPQEVSKERCSKKIGMYKDIEKRNLIKSFSSISDAARYLQEIKVTSYAKINGIASHIGQAYKGKRKSACGYYWKLLE